VAIEGLGPIAFTCESLTFPDSGVSTIALHSMSQPEECAFLGHCMFLARAVFCGCCYPLPCDDGLLAPASRPI
jgi:hypothetical protein